LLILLVREFLYYQQTGFGQEIIMRDLGIVMLCLNEAENIAFCIEEAKESIARLGVDGEDLVADNGSTDGSGRPGMPNPCHTLL
jgi:hypothetical protein